MSWLPRLAVGMEKPVAVPVVHLPAGTPREIWVASCPLEFWVACRVESVGEGHPDVVEIPGKDPVDPGGSQVWVSRDPVAGGYRVGKGPAVEVPELLVGNLVSACPRATDPVRSPASACHGGAFREVLEESPA